MKIDILKPIKKEVLQYFSDVDQPEFTLILSDIEYYEDVEVQDLGFITQRSNILTIIGSSKVCKTLNHLTEFDRERVIKAFKANDNLISESVNSFRTKEDNNKVVSPKIELICNILTLKSLLIGVATGVMDINDYNDEYIILRKQTERLLSSFTVEYKFDFDNLWDWYHFWKQRFSSYQERRSFINERFKGLLKQFVNSSEKPPREKVPLTGWDRVDRVLSKAQDLLNLAKNEEDFQQIGLLCREVFITLGQILYKPDSHSPIDDVIPSKTDAKRHLETYIENEVSGKSKSALRKYLRSAIDLSLDIQHRRTANKIDAGICLEATFSVTNTIKIIESK